MLKETIYSSLFILASKRNRVRVGYELFETVRGYCSEHRAKLLCKPCLVAPTSPNFYHQNHACEKDGFCAGVLLRACGSVPAIILLSGTNIPPFPPTRFILWPPVGGTEKTLFLLRALSQKIVISQCLLAMNLI